MRLLDPNDERQYAEPPPAPTAQLQPRRSRTRVLDGTLANVARSMNEQLTALRFSSAFNEYVCECGRKTCHDVIALSLEEYREIRKTPTHYLVASGHAPVAARVAHQMTRYDVVERPPPRP